MGNPDQQSFASVLGRTGQWNPNANGYQNTFASGYQYGPMPSQQPRRIISNLDTPDQQSFASVFNSTGQLNPNANGFQHTFASGCPYGPLPSSQYPVYQPYHPDIGWSYPTTGPKVLRQTPMKPTAGTFGHNAPTKRDRDWEDTGKKLARMYTGSRYGEDHDYQSIMQTVPTEHLTYTNGPKSARWKRAWNRLRRKPKDTAITGDTVCFWNDKDLTNLAKGVGEYFAEAVPSGYPESQTAFHTEPYLSTLPPVIAPPPGLSRSYSQPTSTVYQHGSNAAQGTEPRGTGGVIKYTGDGTIVIEKFHELDPGTTYEVEPFDGTSGKPKLKVHVTRDPDPNAGTNIFVNEPPPCTASTPYSMAYPSYMTQGYPYPLSKQDPYNWSQQTTHHGPQQNPYQMSQQANTQPLTSTMPPEIRSQIVKQHLIPVMGQTYDIQSQPAQSLRNDLTQMQWASLADNLDASLADDRLNRQDTWMKAMRDEINSKLVDDDTFEKWTRPAVDMEDYGMSRNFISQQISTAIKSEKGSPMTVSKFFDRYPDLLQPRASTLRPARNVTDGQCNISEEALQNWATLDGNILDSDLIESRKTNALDKWEELTAAYDIKPSNAPIAFALSTYYLDQDDIWEERQGTRLISEDQRNMRETDVTSQLGTSLREKSIRKKWFKTGSRLPQFT